MIHFDLPKEKSSILKVIGVGGGGSNAVNHMFSQNIEGVNFIICNTDAQAIAQSKVPNKIQLGPHLTQGLGAGANPEIGKQATEESLEEIKRILEVNTKMAFITAGMGGGTGTGGAPIISKICKDLGILTVGIVTTPFAYEGKKRQLQAEEGISQLKDYVDTLLVISNDKLRHQFGNLKMKDAFAKADNVLATAAKCITDVINSTGQINVDFADVCTVMRNGGVAILGSASAEGEDRAQRAIEEALSSPLLNDNDIRGAKWILININSAEGDHEFTMDEVEVIQDYLLSHAGEETDVILGLGYDYTLERKIGITLIATGFEHKMPFYKKPEVQAAPVKEEKIVMTLNPAVQQAQPAVQAVAPAPEQKEVLAEIEKPVEPVGLKENVVMENPLLMPTISEAEPVAVKRSEELFLFEENSKKTEEKEVVEKFELKPPPPPVAKPSTIFVSKPAPITEVSKAPSKIPTINKEAPAYEPEKTKPAVPQPAPAVPVSSNSRFEKPAQIYAETIAKPDNTFAKPPVPRPPAQKEEETVFEMKLIIKEDMPADEDQPKSELTPSENQQPSMEDLPSTEEGEEQKRRASERINKLRNLSFNINGADPNNEFETVPAYIRRNLELYNTTNNVENFYSSYSVKADDNNKSQITSINTFLDGKKPD